MPKHTCKKSGNNEYEWPCRACRPEYYRRNPDIKWFVLHVVDDLAPGLQGPYQTEYGMDKAARKLKEEVGNDDGVFWLKQKKGRLETGSWNGGFFMKESEA